MEDKRERIRCILRERRIELSLTQKEVAERAGIKFIVITMIIGGTVCMTL